MFQKGNTLEKRKKIIKKGKANRTWSNKIQYKRIQMKAGKEKRNEKKITTELWEHSL